MANSMSTNLMVTDMGTSLRFYHEVLGLPIAFCVDADQQTDMSGTPVADAVFASLRAGDSELMLQERMSLAEDAPMVTETTPPAGTFTLYFRVDDVDAVADRLPEWHEVVKPLQLTWYGMKEIWVRDPDGYVVTIGMPEGDPPA